VFELTVEIPFSAAHRISGHPGPCAQLHGHNYKAVVTIAGEGLDELGMLVDFDELRQVCARVIEPLDHAYLNELAAFSKTNPTSEALARHIYQALAVALPARWGDRVTVAQVTVYESERSSATYYGEVGPRLPGTALGAVQRRGSAPPLGNGA
jgi:6-pyruvoyltetrahydropterin/6-carboxytetrahydropterin synthase